MFPRQFSRPVCLSKKRLDGKLIRARGWYNNATASGGLLADLQVSSDDNNETESSYVWLCFVSCFSLVVYTNKKA